MSRCSCFAWCLVLLLGAIGSRTAHANNPGDPLFCQPNEGNTFLITNSGSDVFTIDPDCYNNFTPSPPTASPITTSHGGTMTPTVTPSGINYVYTPPAPGYTGLDSFNVSVTTSWNATGGTGSNSGAFLARPGGASTETVTLNVLNSTSTATVVGPTVLPIPAGSVSGCGPQGNAGQGPPAGTIAGCVTAIAKTSPNGVAASKVPLHGTLTVSGNSLLYTPAAGYAGSDTFSYFVEGTNTDGTKALSSGEVTITVTIFLPPAAAPALSPWMLLLLALLLAAMGWGLTRARQTH